MRTLKFKAQFFATFNQMSDGSSQLPTIAEHCVIWTVLNDLITTSFVVGCWDELPDEKVVAKNVVVGWALNFRVRILLKSAARCQHFNGIQYGYQLLLKIRFAIIIIWARTKLLAVHVDYQLLVVRNTKRQLCSLTTDTRVPPWVVLSKLEIFIASYAKTMK